MGRSFDCHIVWWSNYYFNRLGIKQCAVCWKLGFSTLLVPRNFVHFLFLSFFWIAHGDFQHCSRFFCDIVMFSSKIFSFNYFFYIFFFYNLFPKILIDTNGARVWKVYLRWNFEFYLENRNPLRPLQNLPGF